jgi:hypothetical protein
MIEFQYFNHCPNSKETLHNLRELIKEGVLRESELIITEVPDLASAEKINFQGSPTILIDGVDLYDGKKPDSFHYCCRIYDLNGRQTGVLSKDFIKTRLKTIRG